MALLILMAWAADLSWVERLAYIAYPSTTIAIVVALWWIGRRLRRLEEHADERVSPADPAGELRDRRARIVDQMRELVRTCKGMDRIRLVQDPRYEAVRPYLAASVRDDLEAGGARVDMHIAGGRPTDHALNPIRDEADRLEREWDLI